MQGGFCAGGDDALADGGDDVVALALGLLEAGAGAVDVGLCLFEGGAGGLLELLVCGFAEQLGFDAGEQVGFDGGSGDFAAVVADAWAAVFVG
ncbi:hypothetical protein JN531_012050 [Flagellatimonas centrodinii]|uniref:hypothetical protein n=1 Tax=Flagellatimonas centrodinii TaxID=2806210 RepID=UPI001FEF9D19|nr:hypothetical protein [Flagellatimonas centrodinii]ULQ45832.1 hypothetical protein JN531_012050 [Flagellatimonas centrodinii]